LSPFAPHIAEETFHLLGNSISVCDAPWPQYNEEYLKETNVIYPVSFNGKVRFSMELSVDLAVAEIEKAALSNEQTLKMLGEKTPKKIIIVPKKIINIVF
jgi:leucyl-tRNA synthetase